MSDSLSDGPSTAVAWLLTSWYVAICRDSPSWLVDEVARTRSGLIRCRQNVILLQSQEDADAFYPVSAP